MKKTKIVALLLAALITSGCGGASSGETTVTNEQGQLVPEEMTDTDEEFEEEEEAEVTEPEYDYDAAAAAEEVKKLNAEAESIANSIGGFLAEAAAGGYGMTEGGTLVTAYVEGGLWSIYIDDTDYFTAVEDDLEWWGYGEADAATDTALAEDNDTLFAAWLCKAFPHITDASIGAWVENGECKAVYYTDDTTSGDFQIEFLLGEGGWLEPACEWDTYNQGVSDEGNLVGTYPVLGIEIE